MPAPMATAEAAMVAVSVALGTPVLTDASSRRAAAEWLIRRSGLGVVGACGSEVSRLGVAGVGVLGTAGVTSAVITAGEAAAGGAAAGGAATGAAAGAAAGLGAGGCR